MGTAILIFSGMLLGSIMGKLTHMLIRPESLAQIEPTDIFGAATAILIVIDRFFI